MHLKTHFKVLFNSSKISKTCAHIIFLLNTRHYQELNKIGTITFGSTKLDLHIFESCTQICETQNKQNQKGKPNQLLGQPKQLRRPTTACAHSPEQRSPVLAPSQHRRLANGTRASARENRGRRRRRHGSCENRRRRVLLWTRQHRRAQQVVPHRWK